ncbi:protein-tyrosine phosphatase family protein [Streptomyces sp. NPDC048275]|uniref:protein-tyrosine phosphatase family protein n=1 Tax=Streptomyces sp. NPDC048275 TaxID=3155629 RepID=UPI0033DA3544
MEHNSGGVIGGRRCVAAAAVNRSCVAGRTSVRRKAGLDAVRLPVRDGQTPTPRQVERFLDLVGETSGPVFVHCGAGVGRTGAMAAAHLVRTGELSPPTAVRRNLAVGPPSIEQISYGLSLGQGRAHQPPFPVIAVNRLVDAPRRAACCRGFSVSASLYCFSTIFKEVQEAEPGSETEKNQEVQQISSRFRREGSPRPPPSPLG